MQRSASVKVGIREAMANVAGREFLRALYSTDEEADAEHERQVALAAINEANNTTPTG